jgi:Arc-like DNA binding domain
MRKINETFQFNIRITEGLRRRIEKEAKRTGRTANAEAVERLERSFADAQTADTIRGAVFDAFEVCLKTLNDLAVKQGGVVPHHALFAQLRDQLPTSGVQLRDQPAASGQPLGPTRPRA